jgi:hypothetical protein
VKFWLIISLLQNGEYIKVREIAYPDEATCYIMMEPIARQYTKQTVQMVCVGDDIFKQVPDSK